MRNLGSQFRLGRHYGVFASLAGVRNYGDEIKPVSAPRGVPENLGYATKEDYLCYVCDDPSEDSHQTDREHAERWVASGSSKWADERHVTDPDAHSASWLTPDEFEAAINCEIEGKLISDTEDYQAVLAAMRSLESTGHEVRTVFWFDN